MTEPIKDFGFEREILHSLVCWKFDEFSSVCFSDKKGIGLSTPGHFTADEARCFVKLIHLAIRVHEALKRGDDPKMIDFEAIKLATGVKSEDVDFGEGVNA